MNCESWVGSNVGIAVSFVGCYGHSVFSIGDLGDLRPDTDSGHLPQALQAVGNLRQYRFVKGGGVRRAVQGI